MELTLDLAKKWIKSFDQSIHNNKDYLNELDTAIGDGDHGTNMDRGAQQIDSVLATESVDLSDLLKKVAFALISKVGGASGPLYGTAFLDMSKKAKETNDLNTLIATGTNGVQRRGKAKLGDKTMLDVWQPVSEDMKNNAFNESNLQKHLEAEKPLVAKKGRASYLEGRSANHLDPGAQSSYYLFNDLLKSMK